jgi:hypothetical protein
MEGRLIEVRLYMCSEDYTVVPKSKTYTLSIIIISQTVYLHVHTTIDNYTLKFVVQYPICSVACNL